MTHAIALPPISKIKRRLLPQAIHSQYSQPTAKQVATASSAESLLPVQLDDAVQDAYHAQFFPRRVPPKGSPTQRKHWAELCKYLTEVSAFVNAALADSRYLVSQAPSFTAGNKEHRAHYHKQFLNSMLDQVSPSNMEDKEVLRLVRERVANSQRVLVEALGSGTKHIIRPSVKFKGGYDIIYSGLPATSTSAGTAASYKIVPQGTDTLIPDWKIEPRHMELTSSGGALTLPLGEAAVDMATQVIDGIFDDPDASNVKSNDRRILTMLPLNFDFAEMMKKAIGGVVNLGMGIELDRLVSKMPTIPQDVLMGLKKNFSILAIREANPASVRRKIKEENFDSASLHSQSAHVTGAIIGFSFVMHLPQELVGFITQTKPGGKVPLTSLNTWASIWSRAAIRIPRQKAKKGEPGGEPQSRVHIAKAPRYVMSASSTAEIAARRKSIGLYTEDGRTNTEDLFVSNIGTLNFCPKSGALALDNAKNYERILEDALQTSFDAGSPLAATQQGVTDPVFSLANPTYREKIAKLKTELTRYRGSMQAFSWDYNMILTTAMTDPEKLNAINLAGAARPDELGLSDYLKKPFCKSMRLLFIESRVLGDKSKAVSNATFGEGGTAGAMIGTSLFAHTFQMYAYLMGEKGNVVPSLQELVEEAAKDLGITSLEIGEETPILEKNLYAGFIKNDLKVMPTVDERKDPVKQMEAVSEILKRVLKDAAGGANSNLARLAYSKGEIPADRPQYFDPEEHTLAEFKNVYNYLGGRIFYQMMRHMMMVDKKALLVLNIDNPIPFPNFSTVVREVMPLATILSKYVTESEEIYKIAEEQAAGNERDTSISASDIHLPGSKGEKDGKPGFQLFPHQVEGQQYLRNDPRFAILDVAPGGGKTIAVVTDIGCLIGEGKIKRPLVLCPNGLVKNWVEDTHKVTQGKWNVIPITTKSFKTWGEERLTKMIVNAPPNTIVVVGMKTLQIQKYPVVIGNHVENVSGATEFVKKFGFDYVAIDESHRVKNPKSAVHRTVKQLTTASCVKFIRLATGTLISNVLTDVVGQAAMFNAQIFRTPEEYTAANQHQVGDSKVMVWNDGTADAARKQLSRHAAVISAKRKEWAFMLPVPIEEFISVGMTKRTHYSEGPGDPDGPIDEKAGGECQQRMYNTMLTEVMDELKADKDIQDLLSGHGDDDDDDDAADNDDEDLIGDGSGGDLDDATLAELSMKLNPYLQRLEMMLTDPLHSDVGQIYFDKINQKNFVSNKVLKVIERIRLNFQSFPWQKGKDYEIKDICDVGNERFVLMPPKDAKFGTEAYRANYVSKINPKDDPRWKPEPRGKVIVFCRYTSSVNCIYEHLPADLKKLAVKFHGEVPDKWANLDAFKSVPVGFSGVQIMIANEMAISEGHNLQMANRLIRVEAPWAPGELDQAASRIFRPDPSGKFSRENVYLDWILTDNSLEVAKMGRLISKMVIKSQFDEANNPLYEGLRNFQLPLISMSLKTLEETPTLASIEEYVSAYGTLIGIQATEFAEMRATKPTSMFDVPETGIETLKGQGIIEYTPYVPNQQVPDRHNFGLVGLVEYLQDDDNPEVKAILQDGTKLLGKYAHTEMGNGTIIKVALGNIDKNNPNAPRKISRVHVKIEGQEDVYAGDPDMIHLATNLTAATIKEFGLKQPWATKADQKKAAKLEAKAALRAEKEAARAAKAAKKEKATLKKLKEIENLKKKAGKKAVKKAPPPVVEEDEEENNNVALYPVVYNGFLAIEAIPEDDSIHMEPFGYKQFGAYAYAAIRDLKSFDATLAFLQKKFTLPSPILKNLVDLRGSFAKKFQSESVQNVSEFKNFYRLRHTVAKVNEKTKKTELKVYPVILNNVLMLNVDLATNPKFNAMLDKVVPDTKAVKFTETDGLEIQFFASKALMLAKYKEMVKEGFEVTNAKEFLADLKTINPKMKNI